MNKEVYRTKVGAAIKEVIVKDDLTLVKSDKTTIIIKDYHESDCCESVYADFDTVDYYKKEITNLGKVKNLVIKAVPEMGFLMCFETYSEYDQILRVFVPCYEFQNGYYSGQLELIVEDGDTTKKVDITDLVESHMD